MMRENRAVWPWYARLYMQIFFPKNYSKVKDMKKASKRGGPYIRTARWERSGIVEYLDDISKTDEHYFRVYENSDCWGLENVGAAVASHLPPLFAGFCKGFEKEERKFRPHLTLARIKYIRDREVLQEKLAEYRDTVFQKIQVEEIIYYESILRPGGPSYLPLATVPFKSG